MTNFHSTFALCAAARAAHAIAISYDTDAAVDAAANAADGTHAADAARAAAYTFAGGAERQWQTQRLRELLEQGAKR